MLKHAGLASKMVLASIFAQVAEASNTHSILFLQPCAGVSCQRRFSLAPVSQLAIRMIGPGGLL
jgi:hypothetical protein